MKKIILMVLAAGWVVSGISAQKFFTREGKVSFFSKAPTENIEAHNQKVLTVLDAATGRMEFSVLIKAFQFEKALMQEHFNENYLESSKFPKATFKGAIVNAAEVNFQKDGAYPVKVKGDLTIHGQTRPIEADGTITVKGDQISTSSSFNVTVADYGISIPAVVRDNIAKTVRVDVSADLLPLDEKAAQ